MGFLSKIRQKRRLGQIMVVVVLVICIGYVTISSYRLNQSISEGNRKTVLNYGNQVAARIGDLFEQMDISLSQLSNEIETAGSVTLDEVDSQLDEYNQIWGTKASGLLYENGENHLSDGSSVEFETEIQVRDVLSFSQKLNISRQKIDGTDMLVFAKPCSQQINGQSVSGVFVAMDISQLETFLGDEGYSDDSFLVLVQADGNIIWKQENVLSETETANCFDELEGFDIAKNDSVLQMETRMSVGMDGTISYSRDGQNFYMSYVPLDVNYWYLLVSAKSDTIDLTALARRHNINSLVLVIVIFAMSIACILYLYQRNRSISRYNEQLKVTTKLANEANRANQANRAKQIFLAKISHDIRTPLNGVMGMITLAKEEYEDKDKCLTYLDKATVSAKYLLGLLNDVLDMSQIESGKHTLVEDTVDMKELVKEVEILMETSAKEKGLTFELTDSDMVHRYFKADRIRLKQILTNLTSNAVKYTPRGGWVHLEVGETGEGENSQVFFKVKDNGEGIAEDKLETIFKAFEQVGTTRQGGVGLGLSIVHSFVELMGGQITVESKLNEGSTFTVTLPLVVETEARQQANEEISNTDLSGVSILMAEDNVINAEIAIKLLKNRGANIINVWDGEMVVENFRQNPSGTYDIILMDIHMPKVDGLEATRQIRQLDRPDAREIPILAMTANAFNDEKDEMQQAGINGVLYKPININQVCRCIKEWIQED